MPKSFGAATIAYVPRAVLLDEGENPTTSTDHDRVKTLHLVRGLCPAIAIIDLPNANVNDSAHQGLTGETARLPRFRLTNKDRNLIPRTRR
jgi:hypothetical protein